MKRKINIGSHVWEVNLSDTKELEFYYLTEDVENTDSIWNDWDGTDHTDTIKVYHYEDDILPEDVSVFRVISEILKASISLIESSGTEFFYFSASTDRKGSFYEKIIEKFTNEIEGDWSYQVIDSNWFYISKN